MFPDIPTCVISLHTKDLPVCHDQLTEIYDEIWPNVVTHLTEVVLMCEHVPFSKRCGLITSSRVSFSDSFLQRERYRSARWSMSSIDDLKAPVNIFLVLRLRGGKPITWSSSPHDLWDFDWRSLFTTFTFRCIVFFHASALPTTTVFWTFSCSGTYPIIWKWAAPHYAPEVNSSAFWGLV